MAAAPGTQWCAVCRSNLSDPAAGRLAAPAKRLAASLLDGAVPFGGGLFSVAVARDELEGMLGLAVVAAYAVWSLVLFGTGRTPGKLLLGTRVVGEDRATAGFLRMLFREWIGKPVSGMFLLLGYLWILFDRDKQGWHDKLMSTFVVETPAPARVLGGDPPASRWLSAAREGRGGGRFPAGARLAIILGAAALVAAGGVAVAGGGSLFRDSAGDGRHAIADGGDDLAARGEAAADAGGGPFDDADDHSCARGGETPLSAGRSASGTLAPGDEDCFAVSVPAGAAGSGVTIWTEGGTDTYGILYDREYAVLAENDDFAAADDLGDVNFQVSASGGPGPYYVRVRGYSDATAGDYVVRAAAFATEDSPAVGESPPDHGNTFETATPIAIGETYIAEEDEDYFVFTIPTGGLTLDIESHGKASHWSSLFDSETSQIGRYSDFGRDGNFRFVRPFREGTYYLKVEGHGNNYALTLRQIELPAGRTFETATSIAIGDTVLGFAEYTVTDADNWTEEQTEDYFTFTVPSDGFRLGGFIDTRGVGVTSQLIDANGDVYGDSGPSDFSASGTLQINGPLRAGQYYLVVSGGPRDPYEADVWASVRTRGSEALRSEGYGSIDIFRLEGSYRLFLSERPPDDHGDDIASATTVAIEETVAGEIYVPDRDYMRFTVPTDGFTAEIFTTGGTFLSAVLYRGDGSSVRPVHGWTAPFLPQELMSEYGDEFIPNVHWIHTLSAGTYYIAITADVVQCWECEDPDWDGGNYALTLRKANYDEVFRTATPVSVGDTVRGRISTDMRADRARFDVTGDMGHELFTLVVPAGGLSLEASVGGDDLWSIALAIHDAGSAVIGRGTFLHDDEVWRLACTLRAGTYYLSVRSTVSREDVESIPYVLWLGERRPEDQEDACGPPEPEEERQYGSPR